MLSKDWSTDAIELLQPGSGIFPDFSLPYTEATTTLFNPPNSYSDYQIQKLCKSLKKYRHLTDESEQTNFAVLCHEVLVIAGPVPSTITESATPLTFDPAPSPDGHVKLSLRKGFSSPRRDRIRKRLEFVSKGKFEMKRKYFAQMKDLNARHHKTVKVKYLNQVIKRKDAIIVKLKKKLVVDSLRQELTTTRIQIAVLTRKHQRLKLYWQCTRTSTSEPIAGNTSKLHHKLQYKNTVIQHLRMRFLCWRKQLKSCSVAVRDHCKTFLPETQMFVYDAIINHVPTRNVPILLENCGPAIWTYDGHCAPSHNH
ncbi:hypothetical protein LSH36_368g05097 [Paralvinella palmiformis]|uniref:Uncharacterized protein n=1 Tax=Paralvinella palmiformis TaxID=53620 RepID=A0AAD9MZ94_9ANNE|nr:hypothetical protein LSH36_368g05097 [Paralvinella palmiformis]